MMPEGKCHGENVKEPIQCGTKRVLNDHRPTVFFNNFKISKEVGIVAL